MRERKYNRYRKEKRIALTILAVLTVAVLAFVLVFSLTAKKDGNPLSSLTPEMTGTLDMNTGTSVSSTDKTDINYALPANTVTEVGSVPSGYSNTTGTLFTADRYKSDFSTLTASVNGTANATITDTEKTINDNYYMNGDVTIDWDYFGSNDEFTGTFDGNGHTITITGNASGSSSHSWNQKFSGSTDTGNRFTVGSKSINKPKKAGTTDYNNFKSYGLFGKAVGSSSKSATIKNLTIVINPSGIGGIEIDNNNSSAFGILTGWLRNGTVENVKIILNNSTFLVNNRMSTSGSYDAAIGLFAGIAGNNNDTEVGKFYNVESEINNTFELNSASDNGHGAFGGIVGQATNIDMKGAKVSGTGTLKYSGSGGWRMGGAFIGMARQGHAGSTGLKAPTNARLKINNLILTYTGKWNTVSNGGSDNSLSAFVGSFGGYYPNNQIKVYTPYNTGSSANIKSYPLNSTSVSNALNNVDATKANAALDTSTATDVYATRHYDGTVFPFTYVSLLGPGNLKFLHTLGDTSSTVIAMPLAEGVYTGATGVTNANFNSAGQYADLSNVGAGQYTIAWTEGFSLPTYSLGWLTDFGKIPYGYGVPDGATAIGSQSDLNDWLGSTSNYGYLTADFTVGENWWNNTSYKTLGSGRVLDGAGHTITLTSHSGWSQRNGSAEYTIYGKTTVLTGCLFHYNEGTIKNLSVKTNAASQENNAGTSRAMLGGLVVGLNRPTGRIENVHVYVSHTWQYECDAVPGARYNIFGSVAGSNEGYVGYSGATITGKLSSSAGKGSSDSSNMTILGGVIGINFGTAEYLTSYGSGTFEIVALNGTKYIGSIVGAACSSSDNSIINSSAMTAPSRTDGGTLNYVFSGFTGTLKTDNSNARAGSVAGYISSDSGTGIYWAITSGNTGGYAMAATSTGTINRKASEGVGIGGGSATGGNIRASSSAAGVIHGYYDYFYNNGSLNIEFENPADINTISCTTSNVKISSALREVEIPKTVLDGNNNITLTTSMYTAVASPTDPYTSNNLGSNKTWIESIALAGRADGVDNNYSPNYVSGTNSGSTITSLPLSGSTTYRLTSDVSITMGNRTSVSQNNSAGDGLWYSGTLDGNGHTLTINLNGASRCHWHVCRTDIDNAHDGWIGVAGILADMLNGAIIKNLHIKFTGNLTFSSDTYNIGYYGLLAGMTLGNTKITNCTIEFSTGTVTMNKTSGDSTFFGGLFGLMGGNTIVEKSVIVGNGTIKLNQSPGKTTVQGLLAARVETTDTTAGYENVILTGSMTSQNAAGSHRISTIFGMKAGWLSGYNNAYYYKRKNIYFYRSSFALKGDRTSLFAESQSSNTGNNSSYVYLNFVGDSSSWAQVDEGTSGTNMARYHHWSSGDISGTTGASLNTNTYDSSKSTSYYQIKNLSGSVIDVLAWQSQVDTVKSNISDYNTAKNNAANLTATVTVDGKTLSSSSNSAMLGMYFSKGKQLYGSTGSYTYRGFVRYAAQTSDSNSATARYNVNRSQSFTSSSTSSGITYTLKAQLSVVGYADHAFGKALSAAESYETVYAKFNKIQAAYDDATGDDKAYYKALLERSAGLGSNNGIGILTVELPPTYSLVYKEGDKTLGTGVHWSGERISVTADTSKSAYVFQAGFGSYRIDITPSFVDIKGLITEYSPSNDLAGNVANTLATSITRTVSNGDENTLPRGQALLYGLSDDDPVYFGQTSDGFDIVITTLSNSLYDDLSAAKATIGTDDAFRNGHFKITGVGNTQTSAGKTYVNLENCGYAVIVDGTFVRHSSDDGGTITVGSSTNATAALFRYQATYNEFRYTGEVSANNVASGWTSFDSSSLSSPTVSGSYVPKRDETIRNFKLQFSSWSGTAKPLCSGLDYPEPGAERATEYSFYDFSKTADPDGYGIEGATDFGDYIRYVGDNISSNTISVTISKITVNESAVSVSLVDNGGTADSKYYDGYNVEKLKNVKLITSTQVSLNYTAPASSLRNVDEAHRQNLADELLGDGSNYTSTPVFVGANGIFEQSNANLDAGTYTYTALFSFNSGDIPGYSVASELYNEKQYTMYDMFTVYPLPLSFTYSYNRMNLSETYTGSRIDFISATASLSAAAEELIKGQYSGDSDKTAAINAVNTAIGNISENQIGIRYLYASDANGVNTMFDHESRRGATYASKTTGEGNDRVVVESGPINAGTYYFSGYVVGNQNFIGLTNDYKELAEAAGMTFNKSYFQNMATNLQAFASGATAGWAIDLAANNGYADAFNFANYEGAASVTLALEHYFDLLFQYPEDLFEQSAKDVRTVAITRATVSVYVKDSAIEYGSVDPLSSNPTKGPVVQNADYVITNTSLSPAVTIRIKPEAFSFDGTTYQYLPVKLANPNNPESSLTAYRNALYVDTDIVTGNPNLIISAVDGNLTVVRKELKVTWAYDTTDSTYNPDLNNGVYNYQSGVKHTMTPTFEGVINNDALDFDIIGDGDMETVGVHKIVAAFSSRYSLDSYNYYLGQSATGYMTVAPSTVTVDFRYYTNSNKNSLETAIYKTYSSGQTLYAVITLTIGGKTYYSTSNNGYWRTLTNDADRLDLTVYPANNWLTTIKNNLTWSASDKVTAKASWTWTGSQCQFNLSAADVGSSYTFTVEMNGFNTVDINGNTFANFNLDMHTVRSVYVYNAVADANKDRYTYNWNDNWNQPIKQKSTLTNITMNTNPADVLASSGVYYNGGNVGNGLNASSSAVHNFSQSDYVNLGYIFDCGDVDPGLRDRNLSTLNTNYYRGLFYAPDATTSVLNKDKADGTWSRYNGFESIIYSLLWYSPWDYNQYPASLMALYFNVNIDNPVTAAIAKNGGINVSVGGVAVTAGQYEAFCGNNYWSEYGAAALTAAIELNDRGTYSNSGKSAITRTQALNYVNNNPYSASLASLLYKQSTYRENIMYNGRINERYIYNTDLGGSYVNMQSLIYAGNATEPSTSNSSNAITSRDLTRKTLVSSAGYSYENNALKGDSFRVNLYATSRNQDYTTGTSLADHRGIMAQFGKLQVVLSKTDVTAPEVSTPWKFDNGYRFTVSDKVGVDTSSISVKLSNNRVLTVANGGLKVVSKTLTNGLVTEAVFETTASANGYAVGADNSVINEIVSITASDLRYGTDNSCNTATYGFRNGAWVNRTQGALSAVDTSFVDTVGPAINITHVGLDNYATDNDSRWETFTADNNEEQARAKKYVTATWRQQNYLWLKYSAGSGKIPCAEITANEFSNFSTNATLLEIVRKYAPYVGTVVAANGRTFGFIRIKNGQDYKNVFFDPISGANWYYSRTSSNINADITQTGANFGGTTCNVSITSDGASLTVSGVTRTVAFPSVGLSRVAIYDSGDFTGTPIFEEVFTTERTSVYNGSAIRLESNTRYYFIAEDKCGNRSEQTLYFSMVDTADAAGLSIVADPVELDDNNLIPYTGGSAIVNGAASDWTPLGVEKLFGNPANPRFGLDMESDGVYNYTVMFVKFDSKIHVAIRSFVDGKITYTLGTKTFDSDSFENTYYPVPVADVTQTDYNSGSIYTSTINNKYGAYTGKLVAKDGLSFTFFRLKYGNTYQSLVLANGYRWNVEDYSICDIDTNGKIYKFVKTDYSVSIDGVEFTFEGAGIAQWLKDNGLGKLEISNSQTVKLYDTAGTEVATATPMVINTDNYNSYLEDTWSNTSVIMRLVGSGESNSLARFYYRYAPDPNNLGAKVPNGPINENVVNGNANLFRNYGWIALPVTVDDDGNVIVDDATSLLFEHTGIYRFEIKIELGAGQNAYLVYKDSFGNWVYNAYAEDGNIRAYKVDQTHKTKYDPYSSQRPYGGAEFRVATEIGYYTVKIDKRIYFLELKNYWYKQENEAEPVENYDPNISTGNTANTEFATIDILKWNKEVEDYTTPLKKQETGDYAGAYNVGMSSASNKNTWVRLDIRSHIQDVHGDEMWYAVHKILADVYVGDKLVSEGVDLPLGSEMNRFEVGKAHDPSEEGTNNSIAIRRLREMSINMPDPSIGALENVKLVYRVYYKYYYSFVIDYQASYANYYGSTPKGEFEVSSSGDDCKITAVSGNLRGGYSLGNVKLKPVALTASDGSVVNFNYSSFAILGYDETNGYFTEGFTVTRLNDRGIAVTENITAENIKPVTSITSAGKHFYTISGGKVTNAAGTASSDYLLMFQRAALRTENGPVVASMTGTQVQFASENRPYSFYGFALAPSDDTLPDSGHIYTPEFNDDNKVNSVIVNGKEYSVEIVANAAAKTPFVKLYDDKGKEVGYMLTNEYDHFTLNGETFSLNQLTVYDGEGHEVGELGRTLTVNDVVYERTSSNPYYTVEKAFINVSRAGNFVKLYDGTNNYVVGTATDNWNVNKFVFFYNNKWYGEPGGFNYSLGDAPSFGSYSWTDVDVTAYYVGSDDEPQANVSRETDVTYLKMFLPDTSNYQFATVTTKHTVRNGALVSDGDELGVNGLANSLFKTADAGEIIGHDAPVIAGVKVSSTVNWSSIMIPDTSYANANGTKPNRTDGVALTAESSISTILARPVSAKSEVQDNDIVNVTFNGAAQGGSAIRIIEDATTINDATGYGTLPSETVVFSIADGDSVASPILAGSYNFNSVTPDSSSIGIANVETAFGAANTDSIANNYYVDRVTGGQNVNFQLVINTLENSFALNRVVKSDGSGYELRITIFNLKQTKDALDFLGIATTDDSGVSDKRYLTDGEFSKIKDMIAAGGKFEGEEALSVGQNLKDAETYYALIETGTPLLLDETDLSKLSENELTVRNLHEKLSQVLEYRFQCALGKVFRSSNNGSDNFYDNMPDFREGRFSDWKFDENTGTLTMVFKGNVNLDNVFFSDRYCMRVSGLADLVADNNRPKDTIAYSTNSWTSDSSLADGQIERYGYKVNGTVENATYISTPQELKDWLSMTDATAAGYATGILVDNIFDFTWGYANGLGGAPTGLDAGRTLNGNGYVIGIVGAEFNNIGNLNMRLTTIDSASDDYKDDFKYHAITGVVVTQRFSAGGAFLQYVNGAIENTNFVYRSTRKYDISDINVQTTNEVANAYGLSVGIISGFAGNRASFNNVSLDIKGQFYVDYIGTQLVEEAYIGVGGFAGYADNIASFNDCTVNYYYISDKTLDNGYTTDRYAVSATISSTSNHGLHLGWGGFAGITGGNGTANRLTATTQVDAEYTEIVGTSPINAIYVGRNANSSKAAWTKAAGMFGFTTRTSTGKTTSSAKVSGSVNGIINKFLGRIAGYLANGGETHFGSIAGEVGSSSSFTNIYTYGTTVTYGKLVGTTRSSLPLIGTSTDMSSSIIHSNSLEIYGGDEGLVDYYFGGNRYDYYEDKDGVKYFYQTTKFINGNKVVYSPFDDYTSVDNGTVSSGWTGWKRSEQTAAGYKIYLDYERTIEVGSIKINADDKSGSFILNTTENGESTTSEYTFGETGVLNQAGENVIGMTVNVPMMTISDQNNTYYFSVPVSRTETDSPRRNEGINIEVLAPAQSFIWEYHTTFYANNLGKTSAVSRVVWNLDQVSGHFDANYKLNDDEFVITGKNEDTPFKHITTPDEVTWFRPALGQFQTMSADSDGTIFQFVYDGQNHNNNISVTVTINGSKQTITADASVDMIDAGVYVVGTFDLGADTTYDGSSGYVFNTAERKGQSRNVTSPQLMVVIYPRVLKLVGGVAKEYDGTTVYEHVIKNETVIETNEDGSETETVNSDKSVNDATATSYTGILTADKNGSVTVIGDYDDKNAGEDKAIGFENQSKREVLVYTDAGKANAQVLLTVKRGQDRKPIIGENGYPELTKVLYSFGNGNGDLDLDDDIPFVSATIPLGTVDGVVAAFYAAIGQVDSVEEVRAAFAEYVDESAIDAKILKAYQAHVADATEIATTEIYNFQARVGGKNASGESGADTDEYYVHTTSYAVITKEELDKLTPEQAAEYEFLSAYVYIAAELYGDRGFNYALVADGKKVPLTSGEVGSDSITFATYNKDAIGNEYVRITPRAIDVWFNGLFQSFYNDDADENYDYKDALSGVTVLTLKDKDGNVLADGAEPADKVAAIRRAFPDLPGVLTDEQVLSFYDELQDLEVEFNIPDAQNTEILKAFQDNEVKKFPLDVNVGGDNFAVNNDGESQVKNQTNPVLTVCHYNGKVGDGKVGEDGLPYVGDGSEQYLSITNRRDVLNLNYSRSENDETFDYSGYNFYLENDIDMNGAATGGINWSTSAAVTFDGGNHAITNFTVAQNASGGEAGGITIGFFLTISTGSTVKNLILADAEIVVYGQSKYTDKGVTTTTITRVGGVAGSNGGTIENVVFEGTIKRFPGSDSDKSAAEIGNGILGGIVGSNGGIIRKALSMANIETSAASAEVRVGSLAGVNVGTIGADCYVVGKSGMVHGENCTVGSVVGQNYFTSDGQTFNGQFVDADGNVVDESIVLDMSTADGAYSATTAALEYAEHTVEQIVRMYALKDKLYGRPTDGNTEPYGSAANPVKVSNFRQLEMALNLPYFYYEITEDIVFNTGFDEEKLDKVMGSGYGYGRIKIAEGKRIVLRYNEANEEIAIVAEKGAGTVTASEAFKSSEYGCLQTQYGMKFYELVLTFFTV